MNSLLNLNTTWTVGNFLNYIEHIFSSTVANWYHSLDEEYKKVLRVMGTPIAMFKKSFKEIETKLIGLNLISKIKLESVKKDQ